MKSLVLQGFVKMFAVRYPPFCCPLPPFFAVLQLSTFCPATVDFLSRHRPQDAKQGKIKCESGGFCPRSLSIRCNGTIYTLPRPGTLGRCLPLYFGQGFARGQRIGNPAALAACCRSFSGWWPLYHCLRSKVLDNLAGKLLPPFAHAERYAGSRTPVSAAAAPAAIVGGGHHTVPRFQGLSRSFGAILRENG